MATARKAAAKRAAPEQTAAATKTVRARKSGVTAAVDQLQDDATPARLNGAKRETKAARVSHAPNGAAVPKASPSRPVKAKAKPKADANGGVPADHDGEAPSSNRDGAGDGEIVHKARAGSSAEAAAAVPIAGGQPLNEPPAYWDRACADLVKRDRILKRLIPKFGPVHLINGSNPFVTLARSVVGQQISVAAAQSVWQRIEHACPKLTPQQFVKLGQENLMGCGLSKRKSEYLIDLAQHFVSGALHVDKWTSMEDEAVIAELTQIRGIGRWTAEMFLIFNLARPDVLPLDDLGLIRAISLNYFSGEPVTRSEAREVAANWEPWRTVATWYMWRSLDGVAE
jgi:DNA-3-methyladenine glycosylase II